MSGSDHCKTRTFVSLFSGAGGLDLGLEEAGWSPLVQVEMHPDAAGTLELHAKKADRPSRIIADRIENVSATELRDALGLAEGELALLAGGPPCQPFTTSGLRQSINDPRASSLFPTYLEFVKAFRPRALLIENVDGMLSAALRHRPLVRRTKEHPPLSSDERKGSFLRWLLQELTGRGYSISWGVAEAADYGVPQMRQRAIVIGVLGQEPCYLPAPQYGRPGLPPYRALREGLMHVSELGPVQPLSQRKREVYRQITPGGNWRSLPDDLKRQTMGAAYVAEGGRGGWWRRLAWDLPAPTILGMPDHSSTALIHPDEIRCLSVNECAALQTFSTDVEFAGTPRSQYQQIGNAVPVLFGKALGLQLARFLDGQREEAPPEPRWHQASANRRIGTHGWAIPVGGLAHYTLNAKVRPDHVWACTDSGERVVRRC